LALLADRIKGAAGSSISGETRMFSVRRLRAMAVVLFGLGIDARKLAASCATSIMNQSVRFSLKIIDDNNLSRLFPGIPGMTLKYTRCAL
jgi:hypothetical protein